jgi:hypothetical protein
MAQVVTQVEASGRREGGGAAAGKRTVWTKLALLLAPSVGSGGVLRPLLRRQ